MDSCPSAAISDRGKSILSLECRGVDQPCCATFWRKNPRFQFTATSGILNVIFIVRNAWAEIAEFKGLDNAADKINLMRSMLQGYFEDAQRPVIFDKSRGWLAHMELAQMLLGRPPKVLVPVRDLREILCSFEKLWRRSRATGPTPQEEKFYFEFQTLEGRCNVLMREEQVVGIAYNRIRDALARGYASQMHFVPFERLTSDPRRTLTGIYQFLGEAPFAHDFDHVEQVTVEDDAVYNLKGLHEIRPKVEPAPIQAAQFSGSLPGSIRDPMCGTNLSVSCQPMPAYEQDHSLHRRHAPGRNIAAEQYSGTKPAL